MERSKNVPAESGTRGQSFPSFPDREMGVAGGGGGGEEWGGRVSTLSVSLSLPFLWYKLPEARCPARRMLVNARK